MQFIARLARGLSVALLATACSKPTSMPMSTPSPTAPTPTAGPQVPNGPYMVSGVLVEGPSPSGRPIESANISAWIDQGNSGYSYMWAHGAILTNADGRYALGGLPDGVTVWLQAWKDGYVQQCAAPVVTLHGDTKVDVQLVSKANLSASTASIPPPSSGFRFVSGTIFEMTAAGKQPVAGAGVDFEPIMDFPASLTFSDAAGRYLLCGLPAGRAVEILAGFGSRVSEMSVPPGQSTGVDIILP